MSYQLVDQVKVWWKTVSDQESLGTYQKTVQTTWNILRETGRLLWLVLCLGLVFVTWLWTTSKTSGQQLRTWYEGIPEPKSENVVTEASQFFASASRTTATKMMTQAREQLGLPSPEATPVVKMVATTPPAAKSAAVPASSTPPAPEPDVAPQEPS